MFVTLSLHYLGRRLLQDELKQLKTFGPDLMLTDKGNSIQEKTLILSVAEIQTRL